MRATGARLAGQALGDSRLHQLTHREENVFFATCERNHLTGLGFDNPKDPFFCFIGYCVKNAIVKIYHNRLSKNLIVTCIVVVSHNFYMDSASFLGISRGA